MAHHSEPVALQELAEERYKDPPSDKPLFHYTSLSGLLGIMGEHPTMWASDVRYMNDAAELDHAIDLLSEGIKKREQNGVFSWLLDRLKRHRNNRGYNPYVISLTLEEDLLSQWRGYCSHGDGVSIGFDPEYLVRRGKSNNFRLGECIYDEKIQAELIKQILDSIKAFDENFKAKATPNAYAYDSVGEICEPYFLRLGGCKKVCVNGHSAGDCHLITRNKNDRRQEAITPRPHRSVTRQLQKA